MRTSVVLGQWLDRPIDADTEVALLADRLGYSELWVPEMAKVDSPAFAASIVGRTDQIELTLGPLAVTVRSAVQIAMAATTVAATGRATNVALGTSSNVVARWHGRSRVGAADQLAATRRDVAALFAGERVNGYRLPQPPVRPPCITVAAFGPRALDAAQPADRMVLNMVTVETAARLAPRHRNTAVWLCAAVDPTDEERAWLARGLVGYLAAPGYGEMFVEAGYGDLVEFARSRPGPKEIFARMPPDLLDDVGLVGGEATIRDRMHAYEHAGVSEVCIVPPAPDLPSSSRTIEALAPSGG
ncbi:LLM class F420-dependent oxidoreductase [Ilumatobacter sp.]|uniref:LLM class F420-dependent oxidoreductase n=1 Tax=Ilumatobacter sp. TaxID=1967498 RepID=UPI003AF73058